MSGCGSWCRGYSANEFPFSARAIRGIAIVPNSIEKHGISTMESGEPVGQQGAAGSEKVSRPIREVWCRQEQYGKVLREPLWRTPCSAWQQARAWKATGYREASPAAAHRPSVPKRCMNSGRDRPCWNCTRFVGRGHRLTQKYQCIMRLLRRQHQTQRKNPANQEIA